MTRYWLNPPRQHIIDWLVSVLNFERGKLDKMKLGQLRAIWHKEMNKWHGEG